MEVATLHKTLQGHTSQVWSVAFSPNSKLIASASFDHTVRLWNIPNGDLNTELQGHEETVLSVAFSPDGSSIVTGSSDNTVRTWSVATKQQVQILNGHSNKVNSVAWSPNGALIASGSYDRTVILWDAISGSAKKKLKSHTSSVYSVSFSPNGNKLASGGLDNTAIIWDVDSGAALIKFAHSSDVLSVCFSPDDQFVVTGCGDSIVRMFDANNGHEEKRFKGHTSDVRSVACSFDGSMIASGSWDNSVRLWDVASTEQLQQLDGHTDTVYSVAFSRDDKFIASGSDDKTICLWNAPSSLQTPTSLLKSACFAGDVDTAKFQLDQGALFNNKDGSTALYAASSKGSKQLVELLIERGADGTSQDRDLHNAFNCACMNDHFDIAHYLLLRCNSLVNEKTADGSTLLHKAVDQEDIEFVRLLLQRGADVNNVDDSDESVLQLANRSKSAEIKAAFIQATSLQNKNLKSIPASALKQTNKFTLRLGNNKFGPDIWDTLTSASAGTQFLVGLFLQSNPSLGTIPDSVAKLGQLWCLSVADCGLSASSIRALALLQNLRSFDVSGNPLGDLPAEFSQLKELVILNVNRCNLSLVPAAIMELLQLRDLDISNNSLHGLPFDLGHLSLLTKLNLTDCPLTTIPSEYYHAPTSELLQFLRDSQESQAVYRSKLLLVGYGEVGKTTLLTALFPLKSQDQISVKFEILGQILREFKLLSRKEVTGRWRLEKEIDLSNATITTNATNEIGWTVKAENSTIVHKFLCSDALERDEWVRTLQFIANNSRTDGISVVHRAIKSKELDSALQAAAPITPNLALFKCDHENRLPDDEFLELSAWDFAGQYEYQDGHQLFLMSRAIYLVLWDVTLSKRKQELTKLRHWLITLQLHLGTTDNNMRSSVLVYIVGTHADTPNVIIKRCVREVEDLLTELKFNLPHRIVDPIDARNQDHVNKLKNQLLADMAVQSHLGELVPKGYLQIEQYLLEEQRKYRLNMLQGGNDVIVPIIQRKVLSEQWHRDISYVTRALELLNLWGSIVYFGRDSNKEQHVFLDELVVYAPEWLTISVLGSIVQLMRQQMDCLNYNPIVVHEDLIEKSPVWQNIPSELHEHVMEMLYSLDLGFSVSPSSDQSKLFAERSSFFPQLLPFLPARSLTWQLITSTTTEVAYIIKLNGFAMGFHGVLFSRLQSLLKSVEYGSCWQCGFLFSDESQSILVTIHDDTQQIRICIRNSSAPFESFNNIKVIVASLIDERYRGVRIIGEFIECPCDKCTQLKWQWDGDSEIFDQLYNDSTIQSLCKDTTSRADLASAIGHYNQPKGSPFLFNIEDITNTPSSQESLICKKSHNSVAASLLKKALQPVKWLPPQPGLNESALQSFSSDGKESELRPTRRYSDKNTERAFAPQTYLSLQDFYSNNPLQPLKNEMVRIKKAEAVGLISTSSDPEAHKQFLGTGFLASPTVLVTNVHVLFEFNEAQQMVPRNQQFYFFLNPGSAASTTFTLTDIKYPFYSIKKDDKEMIEAIHDKFYLVDKFLDVVLVKLSSPVNADSYISLLPQNKVQFLDPRGIKHDLLQEIYVVGAVTDPNSTDKWYKSSPHSSILGFRGYEMRYAPVTIAGMSGSPCLNLNGDLVAIHRQGYPRKSFGETGMDEQFHFSAGVRIDSLLACEFDCDLSGNPLPDASCVSRVHRDQKPLTDRLQEVLKIVKNEQ